MKRIIRNHPYLTIIISAFGGILVTIITVLGVAWFSFRQSASSQAGLNRVSSIYRQIQSDYYRPVDEEKLTTGAINGMLSTLNDPFSDYLTESDATNLNDSVSGSFGGVGIQVVKKNNQVQVMSTIDETPAQKAHLKAGDIILKVNGHDLTGKSLNYAMQLMRGKIGTTVKVQLKRGGQTFTKKIKRAKIPVETVSGKMLKNHVGYITISTVAEKTSSELKTQLKRLDHQGAKSYIIDVRNNPGGLMEQALKMSSMFLKDGKVIMQVKSRSGQPEVYKAGKKWDGGYKVKHPSVVMINGESASAAEIFAAALHQSAKVPIVGSTSYGKGTVQNITQYTDSDELKLTIAKWLTPNGSWIHKKGLKPDYKADYPKMAYITEFNLKKTYQVGDQSQDVKNLQVALKDLGFYHGKISKNYTDDLRTAVINYQSENGLTADGKADAKTMKSIEQKIIKVLDQSDPALKEAQKVAKNKS